VIGQAPVYRTTVFDMASDGETFRVSIPSKNKFLVGPWPSSAPAASPSKISASAPSGCAALAGSPERRSSALEEFNDENGRYYVLTYSVAVTRWRFLWKIWFDRSDCRFPHANFRSERSATFGYSPGGPGKPPDSAARAECSRHAFNGVASFPRAIRIESPHDDYKLDCKSRRSA